LKLFAIGIMITASLALFWSSPEDRAAIAPSGEQLVRDAGELQAALVRARGGERLRLAPGEYGRLDLYQRRFAQPVVVQGPDGPARAHFDTVRIVESAGIRMERIEIGSDRPAADGAYARIQESERIELAGVHVHGSRDGNPRNDGLGVHVDHSSDVTIGGSDLEEVQIGVIIRRSDRVKVVGNHIHTIRSDGVMAAASEQLEISGNYISDFLPDPQDHADGIQLQNVGVNRGTTGVTIADNVIMQGAGEGVQGIWISDGEPLRHRDLTITNNLIYINRMYNGIGLNDLENARVVDNTVVSEPDDEMTAWIRVQNATGVHLERNISDRLLVQDKVTGMTRTDNMFFVGRATPKCLFPRLGAKAAAAPADFVVADIGFQINDRVHPLARTGAQPLARASARKKCAGQVEN
jgi:nitrous oxidase accessory protein NosD